MAKTLLVCQEKGGVGKTLIARGLAEMVPDAPVIEVDAGPRMIELGKRVRFFPMRADRDEVERTGGRAARGEFDDVVDAIASASAPTIVDIGANTAVSLLTTIGGLAQDLSAAGARIGLMVVMTAEPGALADTPKLMALAAPWAAARFIIDNRFRGAVDTKTLVRIAQGAVVTCLLDQALDAEAAEIMQAGGLASIPRLDAATLNKKFGIAHGSRIRRDLTRTRLDVMRVVRLGAEWLVAP
jgi:hypothetical protein